LLQNQGGAGPVVGEIGGYRDKILRSVGQGATDLYFGIEELGQNTTSPAPAAAATNTVAPKTGSISGLVVDTDGDPAPHVLIGFEIANAPIRRGALSALSRGALTNPSTLSDDKGNFTITGLPPGTYTVMGSLTAARTGPGARGGGWSLQGSVQSVTVKEDAETKLPNPLKLN
jgi:hypothetical protein